MSSEKTGGAPDQSPALTDHPKSPKDNTRRRRDASPKELTVHVTSPVPGDDWPQLTFTGGDFSRIIAILKTIPRELRNYDPETKIWSAQPDQLKVRLDEIKTLGITVGDHRPGAPELADACLIAMGDDDQIDDALDALDGVIDPGFYVEVLAARDRRRGLAQ